MVLDDDLESHRVFPNRTIASEVHGDDWHRIAMLLNKAWLVFGYFCRIRLSQHLLREQWQADFLSDWLIHFATTSKS